MTDDQFQKARVIKDGILKLQKFRQDVHTQHAKVRDGKIEKDQILLCFENFTAVLSELESVFKTEFKNL